MRQFILLRPAIVLLLIVIFTTTLSAQKSSPTKFVLSGYVRDSLSGETMIGANIYNKDAIQQGTVTNQYGFYSLRLEKGTYTIIFSFIGYEQQEVKIQLDKNIRININLKPVAIIKEVRITAKRKDENVRGTEMGKIEIPIEKVKQLPVLFGEVDILKTLQLLPGVQSSGEGNTGMYVRGGSPDQNLILLDEAVVYNPGHLFGFFSVFNADAIKNSTLIKGSMPANYGGRLSSVLDITMKEGNNKKFHGDGGVGLIASRFTFEGPIVKNKSSFIISGRRTYIDQLSKPFLKNSELGKIPYYFFDLNTKINYRFSDKDRLFFSGYFGRDIFSIELDEGDLTAGFKWGNTTTTLRWNHLFNDKLFMNVSAIYNDYKFLAETTFETISSTLKSGIEDWNAKVDFDYFINPLNNVKFGMNYTYHIFTPRTAEATFDSIEMTTSNVFKKHAHDVSFYLLDEMTISNGIKINGGLRFAYFAQVGPYSHYEFSENRHLLDSTVFEKGEKVAEFFGLEPRISARYKFNPNTSVKAGVAFSNQFVHLVSNSTTSLPLDIWVPSSMVVKPQKGIQYSIGYFRNFKDDVIETSVEVYYKEMKNQIEFGESYYDDVRDYDVEYEFVYGKGKSYGIEFFIKKKFGKMQGWVGYTLSKTTRQFPDLNDGKTFSARFDRRHDLSVVATYKLNEHWVFSSTFVFGSGQWVTMPERLYFIEGSMFMEYGELNGYKMEPYHRVDLSAVYSRNKRSKGFRSSWAFSVYNAYNRFNPFFYYIETSGDPLKGTFTTSAKKVYIFPILPSITWNFKF